ncbi:MAG: V-type ATP synthase subunit I [Natronomonas sp.]
MLRPKQMSRVSVTGSKRVMDETVEAVHDLNLLHVTEYDGGWEGFEPGDPVEGAEDAAEKLVTVRSLESILDITEEDAGRTRIIDDEELDEELEAARTRVNELDDRRSELEDELREIDEKVDAARPFAELGIDLDLLAGYDSLTATVGEGDTETIRRALIDADEVDGFELFEESGYVAVFVYPDVDIEDVLVGAAFTRYEVPELGDGDEATSPEKYIDDLEHRRQQVESKLETVENELGDAKHEVSGFLLAAEEKLSIEVQKREAPLTFATTENAFVAEGWIPSDRYADLAETLQSAVGDHVDVEELEQAQYDDDGHAHERESVGGSGSAGAEGGEAVAADGGTAMSGGDPPVIQDNSGAVKPFEVLIEVINRPKYSELDPTLILFLTFPLFFGFMIGDLGYGLLYMGMGYLLMSRFESDAIRSLGGVGLYAGVFTAIFGVFYGEFFGLHQLGDIVWDGHPPIHKGLQPHYIYYAYAWLLASVVAGVLHLVVGRVFDFVNNLEHGFGEAFMESGSWIILTLGVWWWVFSTTALGPKPNFMFSVFAAEGMTNPATGEVITEGVALPLGFNGFAPIELVTLPVVGTLTLQVLSILVGLALVLKVEGGIGLVESITQAFGHVVSYTRIAAVLLAKAGMALAVNLLVFGAYLHDGEFHLIFFSEAAEVAEAEAAGEVIFGGLLNAEGGAMLVLGIIFGIVVLVLGHLLVLVLGITSAGLQAVRLEYVEFFGKFYEGGGKKYTPFGYDRTYTTED